MRLDADLANVGKWTTPQFAGDKHDKATKCREQSERGFPPARPLAPPADRLPPFWPVAASVVVMTRLDEGVPESAIQFFAFPCCAIRWEYFSLTVRLSIL